MTNSMKETILDVPEEDSEDDGEDRLNTMYIEDKVRVQSSLGTEREEEHQVAISQT